MSELYSWQAAYKSAISETEPASLVLKIFEARSAFQQRRLSPMEGDEERALAGAEAVLRLLRGEWLDSYEVR